MAVNRSVIRGVGAYLPKRIMTNDDFSRIVETTDEWITERTGIKQRHIAADGELTSDLGIAAARQALVRSGIDPVDIDLVICATATPDRTFPATAVRIQAGLGITNGAAFDIQAVCSGFIYAMTTADNFLKTGLFKRAIVVGAETFSRISTGRTAAPACCSATAPARLSSRRSPSTGRARIAAFSPPASAPTAARGSSLRRWRAGLDQDHRVTCG